MVKDFQNYNEEVDAAVKKEVEDIDRVLEEIKLEGTEDEAFHTSGIDTRRKILPIVTVEQLVLSYEAAKAVLMIREEIGKGEMETALSHLPRLDVPNPDKRAVELYKKSAELIKMKPVFVYMIKVGIEDMHRYNFKDDASITDTAASDIVHLNQRYAGDYEYFKKISLFDHTLDVFELGMKKIGDLGRISGKEIALVACLFHDFGKSSGIRELLLGGGGSSRMRRAGGQKLHQEVSGMYAASLLKDRLLENGLEAQKQTIERLKFIVENHHSSVAKIQQDLDVTIVREADFAARDMELTSLKRNNA